MDSDQYKALESGEILCPHCHKRNPSTAYCCLTCFKVMRPKTEMPLWKQHLQGNRLSILGGLLFLLLSSLTVSHWVKDVEARMESIQANTEKYQQGTAQSKVEKINFINHTPQEDVYPDQIETP